MNIVKKYTTFRENFDFKYENLVREGNNIYFKNQLVEDENKKYSTGDDFLNIGYVFRNHLARMLSNLYPMEFKFRGKKVKSIEGVLQGIKYKDKKTQNLVLKYSGVDAYHTRGANTQDLWFNNGVLYWQGKEMKRDSKEYQLFLDELYVSVLKNPLYKRALLATENKYLLHHTGNENIKETVLTRFEYESRLNSLREFAKKL